MVRFGFEQRQKALPENFFQVGNILRVPGPLELQAWKSPVDGLFAFQIDRKTHSPKALAGITYTGIFSQRAPSIKAKNGSVHIKESDILAFKARRNKTTPLVKPA